MSARAIDELGFTLYPKEVSLKRAYTKLEIARKRRRVYDSVVDKLKDENLYQTNVDTTIKYLASKNYSGDFNI